MIERKRKKTTLFSKYLLLTLPFLLLAITTTGAVLSWANYRYFKKTIESDYRVIIQRSLGEIQLYKKNIESKLTTLARILSVIKQENWQRQIALSAFRFENQEIADLFLIEREMWESAAKGVLIEGMHAKELQMVQQAFGGETVVSRVQFGHGKLPFGLVAVPVKFLGEVHSVLLAEVELKYVWDLLDGIKIGQNGHIAIMDQSGRYIGHREMDRLVAEPSGKNRNLYQKILTEGHLPSWTEQIGETVYFCLGYRLPETDWAIILRQPLPEIYQYLYENLLWAVFITVTICFAAVLTGWLGIRRFLIPVEMLHRQVLRVSKGELDQKVAVDTDDEIGELAMAFNEMTDTLKETIRREVETARDLAHTRNLAVLGTTASKVTHEVGNLLNNVSIALTVLKGKDGIGERGRKALSIIERESGQMKEFINRFLRFARTPELKPAPVSLNRIVEEVISAIGPEAERRGIKILNEWPSYVPTINADEKMIYQAITNIVKNSLEAILPPGTVRIFGKTENGYLIVEVEDTGSGISAEIMDKIFDPFFTTKGKTGTGLGMSIVKTIVTAHRGAISCESKPGEGTRFSIRLPVR